MSLLLRRQTPPAAVGLEEHSPSPPVVWLDGVTTSATTEEFVAVALDDGFADYPRFETLQQLPPFIASEEFVATLAVDEPPPFLLHVDAPSLIYSVTSEDFTTVALVDDPPPSIPAVWRDNDVWCVPADEEYTSPHLSDDDSPPYVVIVEPDGIRILPANEDFAGSLLLDEETVSPILAQPDPWLSLRVVDEDFAGSLPFEEPPPHVFSIESTWIAPPPADEDFSGALIVDEDFVYPLIITAPLTPFTFSFDEEPGFAHLVEDESPLLPRFKKPASILFVFDHAEVIPRPPVPPPPPPPPPKPRPAQAVERQIVIGRTRRIEICLPPEKKEDSDYAILPLGPEVVVRALADGIVETFKDENGGLVVRLTASDGTTYFYAKVTKVKTGRVKKDDAIGVSTGAVIAPKALPASSSPPTTSPSPTEPKGIFGVLPVAPAPAVPKPPPPAARAPQLPPVRVLAKRAPSPKPSPPTTGEAVVMGFGIVGVAIFFAVLIRSWRAPTQRPKKKRSRRR